MFHPTPKEMGLSNEEKWKMARKPPFFFMLPRILTFFAILAFCGLYAYEYAVQKEITSFTAWFGLVLLFATVETTLADHFGPYKKKTRQASVLYGFFMVGGIFAALAGQASAHLASAVFAVGTILLGAAIIVRGFHLFDPHP